MKTTATLILSVLALTGCQHAQTKQKTGTEFATDGTRPVTYVTEEEYQRMTPEERSRLNASIGVEASVHWGQKDSGETQRPPTVEELNKAMAAAKEQQPK